jgi:flagellar biosynthesis/type III secretory pathway M-ring protein FliF/YscJ
MMMLLRSATKKPPRPSVQELAGVPPRVLETDLEFVGQAEEMDPAMTGLELDEGELRYRKLTEQISDMVKANPAEVASLINRWATKAE